MLVRSKPSGYGANDELSSLEMEIVDSQLPYAIDGNGGSNGTPYAPSTEIEIAGSGLRVHTTFRVSLGGTSTFNSGAVTINNTHFITGAGIQTSFQGPVTLDAAATLLVNSASTFAGAAVFSVGLAANGNSLFTAPVTFSDDATFNDPVAVNDNFQHTAGIAAFSATTNIGGTLNLLGPGIALSGIVTPSSSGQIRKRVVQLSSDANQSIGVNTADIVIVPAGVFSSTRLLTILDTDAGLGSTITIVSQDALSGADLRQPNSTPIGATVKNSATIGTGEYRWITLWHNGTANGWRLGPGHWHET